MRVFGLGWYNLVMGDINEKVAVGRVPLVAKRETNGDAGGFAFASPSDEAAWVGTDIKRRIDAGAEPDEIVVFTRKNKELARFGVALSALGVPYTLATKEDVLDDPLVERLLLLLKAVANFGEETALVRAMHVDTLGIDELDIFLLARRASKERIPLVKLCCAPDAPETVLAFCNKLKGWTKFGENHTMAELVTLVVRESALLPRFVERQDAMEKLRVLLTFLEEHQRSHRNARLAELLETLSIMDEYDILKANTSSLPGRVLLMTAHRGKGLGFGHVYITGMNEGNWGGKESRKHFRIPGLSSTNSEEDEADERRLLYVAMTRVKESLTFTYSKTGEDGKEALPSRYLAPLELLVDEPGIDSELSALSFSAPKEISEIREDIKNFVRETLLDRGLAVTALNNYLDCPWKWFYRNLLRVPEALNKHLMYGSAVHASLQWFFDGWAKGEQSSKEALIARLLCELEKEAFTEKDLEDAKRDGSKALAGYFDNYHKLWTRDIENERSIDTQFDIEGEALRLTGKIDKIEKKEDSTVNTPSFGIRVKVVDYKTGKPKSENYIRGKTADSNGDYYRQLVFYKLLLSKYENGKYDMREGEIDFVEPDKKSGKYKKFTFTITDEHVRELTELIQQTATDILSLSFWNKKCDDGDCEWCRMRGIRGARIPARQSGG